MSPLFVLIFWNLEHGTTFHRVCSFFWPPLCHTLVLLFWHQLLAIR